MQYILTEDEYAALVPARDHLAVVLNELALQARINDLTEAIEDQPEEIRQAIAEAAARRRRQWADLRATNQANLTALFDRPSPRTRQ